MIFKTVKKVFMLTGLTVLATGYITTLIVFSTAYFTANKSLLLYINKFGEANLELLFLLFTIPFIVYPVYLTLKEIRK